MKQQVQKTNYDSRAPRPGHKRNFSHIDSGRVKQKSNLDSQTRMNPATKHQSRLSRDMQKLISMPVSE